jgi:hypothetical protein
MSVAPPLPVPQHAFDSITGISFVHILSSGAITGINSA